MTTGEGSIASQLTVFLQSQKTQKCTSPKSTTVLRSSKRFVSQWRHNKNSHSRTQKRKYTEQSKLRCRSKHNRKTQLLDCQFLNRIGTKSFSYRPSRRADCRLAMNLSWHSFRIKTNKCKILNLQRQSRLH